MFDFAFAVSILPALMKGLVITVVATFGGFAVALFAGAVVEAMRRTGIAPLRMAADGYVAFLRCTPLLVQLLWFYYAFPLLVGGSIDNRVAALLTLSLYVGAFYAEIFRGGIVSIDKGQREAAAAIGMSPQQAMTRIILPQALKRMLPSFINQSVIQFK
ncbi:MAG: amino acid ABC transporter permease, partial [Pseudomonadota bacterium]|nr:amino acid ABC transporter permease [Pseudomonadota bacterium]